MALSDKGFKMQEGGTRDVVGMDQHDIRSDYSASEEVMVFLYAIVFASLPLSFCGSVMVVSFYDW